MPDLPVAWHSRGYLPHYDDGAALQSIGYRLADALPAEVLAKLEEQTLDDALRRERIEDYLDAGHGCCLLRDPRNARLVVDGWHHFDGTRYQVHAWCVMPNHVHVLLGALAGHAIKDIVQGEKSFTAKAILRGLPGSAGLRPARNAHSQRIGRPSERHVWQAEYYDRFVRNAAHYSATVEYIHQNPVKAGLVRRAEDWPWSSAAEWRRRCGAAEG